MHREHHAPVAASPVVRNAVVGTRFPGALPPPPPTSWLPPCQHQQLSVKTVMAPAAAAAEGSTPRPAPLDDMTRLVLLLKQQLAEQQAHMAACAAAATRETADATTQTDSPCKAERAWAGTPGAACTPSGTGVGRALHVRTRPCEGAVEAAVQQACVGLLTPTAASTVHGRLRPEVYALNSRAGGVPGTAADADMATPAPMRCPPGWLCAHPLETPMSNATVFSTVRATPAAATAAGRTLTPPGPWAPWPAGTPPPANGPASSHAPQPHAAAGQAADAHAVDALALGVPAAALGNVAAFTPNTTALRLGAAMRWMKLQLEGGPSHTSRPRRYSDSSVSPAQKILGTGGAGCGGWAPPPCDGAAAAGHAALELEPRPQLGELDAHGVAAGLDPGLLFAAPQLHQPVGGAAAQEQWQPRFDMSDCDYGPFCAAPAVPAAPAPLAVPAPVPFARAGGGPLRDVTQGLNILGQLNNGATGRKKA